MLKIANVLTADIKQLKSLLERGAVKSVDTYDSARPIGKTLDDVALVLDTILKRQSDSYTRFLASSWDNITIRAVDHEIWWHDSNFLKPYDAFNKAYNTIRSKAKLFVEKIPLVLPTDFELNGRDSLLTILLSDFRTDFENYLTTLESTTLKDFEALRNFKVDPNVVFPPNHNQGRIDNAAELNLPPNEYKDHLDNIRLVAKEKGIDHTLSEHRVDVIVGPADSQLTKITAAAGYPVASLPLGFLDYNGRGFGIVAIAKAGQEGKLLELISAWDEAFSPAKLPSALLSKAEVLPVSSL